MYCPKCGKLIPVDAFFCPGCGCKIQNEGIPSQSNINQQTINQQSVNQQYQNTQFYNPQYQNYSNNSKVLGIFLGVSAAIVFILLFYVVIFGDQSSFTTHSVSNSSTAHNDDTYSSDSHSNNGRIDLYYDRTLSESKLVRKYDFFKNDFHTYPDTKNITIIYLDGDIHITIDEDNADDYCFLDICIGDSMDSIKSNLSGKFKLINRYSSADGTLYRLYEDKEHENGYLRIYGRETVQSIFYFETENDMTDKEVW